ncbi:MAG: 2,4-diacetylphloroglucinol biosynthesis protein [Spirochaetes bacterium]|nr:2,4-diacetylphloroglucinol biosynthesis protein [Spirochaetota bacterium]MBU1081933.1 2,4-diacetylphloroglucinol biosynthesis protein [Spirochaetota bacterium]
MSREFPEPIVRVDTFSSAVWYRGKRGRYLIEGSRCGACGERYFPPRAGLLCPACLERAMEPYRCADSGAVVACVLDDLGFPAWGYGDDLPRRMVVVKLDDGIHVLGDVVDIGPGEVVGAGLRVRAVLRKHRREDTGAWVYGFRFVLDRED